MSSVKGQRRYSCRPQTHRSEECLHDPQEDFFKDSDTPWRGPVSLSSFLTDILMNVVITGPVTQSNISEDLKSQEAAKETSQTLVFHYVNVADDWLRWFWGWRWRCCLKEKQCTYNVNIEARWRNHRWLRKTTHITNFERMSVTLVIQDVMRMRSIILSSVACPAVQYFPKLSHKRHKF